MSEHISHPLDRAIEKALREPTDESDIEFDHYILSYYQLKTFVGQVGTYTVKNDIEEIDRGFIVQGHSNYIEVLWVDGNTTGMFHPTDPNMKLSEPCESMKLAHKIARLVRKPLQQFGITCAINRVDWHTVSYRFTKSIYSIGSIALTYDYAISLRDLVGWIAADRMVFRQQVSMIYRKAIVEIADKVASL